jgi:para-aminobenzoate synthetase / 4-amino-4-deoxychorismate lyase
MAQGLPVPESDRRGVMGVAFVDGEQVDWPGPGRIDDPAMVPGSGLFETMRGRNGEIPLASRHVARLVNSASQLGLRCPPATTLERFLQQAASVMGTGDHRVRLVLTDGGQVVVQASRFELDQAPVRLATVIGPVQAEGFATHKTTAYLPYAQARQQAEKNGAEHALLIGPGGAVLEAEHANIVAAVRGALVTPNAADVLPGIARAILIERLGVRSAPLTVADLRRSDAVYAVNALRGVIPIAALDGDSLSIQPSVEDDLRGALPELHKSHAGNRK